MNLYTFCIHTEGEVSVKYTVFYQYNKFSFLQNSSPTKKANCLWKSRERGSGDS